MAPDRKRNPGTATQVLDVAEALVQRQGFNGFSYADIAAELRVTKPALHYHFATKAELGEALIVRYADRFMAALALLDTNCSDGPSKLSGYMNLYVEVLRNKRMCLSGMLAAEYQTLPAAMQEAVVRFFDHNESWLEAVLERGRNEGSLIFEEPARDRARTLIAALEGAMLVARPYGDVTRLEATTSHLLQQLANPPLLDTVASKRTSVPRQRRIGEEN